MKQMEELCLFKKSRCDQSIFLAIYKFDAVYLEKKKTLLAYSEKHVKVFPSGPLTLYKHGFVTV